MLPTEDGGGIPNPVTQESFIKMILVEQVGLLISLKIDLSKFSIQRVRKNIRYYSEQAIRDKITIRE